ncbi:MAG: membrane integrity-associated transporter subunit PqiC [Rhodocyclales bacterium]|nr:membrane integrity-associated transporter subunit PqiC [Rhodocyclales bacterium]
MKKILLAVSCLALFAACAGGRGRADIAVYDLGPAVLAPSAAAAAHAGLALEVRLPPWLDDQAMNYRLAYADAQRLHAYAQARWAASPQLLLQQRLRQQLAVAPGGAPCTLRIELDDFSQSFASPAASSAVLRGEALLLGKGRAQRARQPLQIDVPAATADAAGGAAALAAAGNKLSTTLAQWLQGQDLAACQGAGQG